MFFVEDLELDYNKIRIQNFRNISLKKNNNLSKLKRLLLTMCDVCG